MSSKVWDESDLLSAFSSSCYSRTILVLIAYFRTVKDFSTLQICPTFASFKFNQDDGVRLTVHTLLLMVVIAWKLTVSAAHFAHRRILGMSTLSCLILRLGLPSVTTVPSQVN